MAKGMCEGVAGVARKITKQQLGVSGVARNVTDGFIGVSGVARQFWDSGFNFLSHNYTTEEVPSGGSTTFNKTINSNTLKIEVVSTGDASLEEYDYVQYVIHGLKAGDVIAVDYDWYTSYLGIPNYDLAEEFGGCNADSTNYWSQTSKNRTQNKTSHSRTVTIKENGNAFYHTVRCVGNYEMTTYIDVKLIKLNGVQIFPC